MFTSAAMMAVRDYLKDIAFGTFHVIGTRYEPNLIFGRQLREVVAEMSGDFAKKNKDKRWLLIGYAREPLTYQLKRVDVYSEEYDGRFAAKWKRREVNSIFKYIFISPSPELLEEVEEKTVVMDLGTILYPSTNVVIRDEDKKEKYTYPFENFSVNVQKFEIQNFSHIDDMNEGIFSIFSMNAIVNFPVFVVSEVYDKTGWCSRIHLTVEVAGEITNDIWIPSEDEEYAD